MRDFFTRWSYRLIFAAFAVAICYVLYLVFPVKYFRFDQLDPRLPEAFHLFDSAGIFWGWVTALILAAVWAGFRIRAQYRRYRNSLQPEPVVEASRGWSDGAQPEKIGFPPGSEIDDPVYLFLAPSDGAVRELLRASGVEMNGRTALTIQPRRAILINAAGLSLSGRPDWPAESSPGLETLCKDLLERDPDLPPIRGVFVVLPVDGPWRRDPASTAQRLYHDLQLIRRIMKIETPTYLRFTRAEQNMPSFVEYAHLRGQREPNETVQGRWGVSFLRRERDDLEGDPVFRRLVDYRFRTRRRLLELIVQNPLDTDRNRRLTALDGWLGELISPMASLVVVAFPAADPDRPFLRAVDIVATGDDIANQAYAYSSVFLPLLEDGDLARWTAQAIAEDRGYRRKAAWLLAISGLLGLAVWFYIALGLASLGMFGWIGFSVFCVGWIVGPVLLWRRWPDPYPSRPIKPRSAGS